ncbi:MAG: DUF2309 domain-containing protein [Cyclobacteriaceae bacterium]
MKSFDESEVLLRLKHFLPHQAPLKNFVHHNTLSAFMEFHFEDAISRASKLFGNKTSLNIEEYRQLYKDNRIQENILEQVIIKRKGKQKADEWIHHLFHGAYNNSIEGRLGHFREWWKKAYQIDLDHEINSLLFKLLGGYLDQGIASWHFPVNDDGFLTSVRELEINSRANYVRTKVGLNLIFREDVTITELLEILVGDESLFESYLFEQQFSHPGWSGMVATIEKHPEYLADSRPITLEDVILFELILEIDAIEYHHRGTWKPFSMHDFKRPEPLFSPTSRTIEDDVIAIWQEAYEWSYYDSVLAGIQKMKSSHSKKTAKKFQALFCIDDREGSIRRHIETLDPNFETFGTPGHFGINMYYQPKNSKFYAKVCPEPLTPQHLVKEIGKTEPLKKEIHFSKWSYHPLLGYPYSLIVGFWSGLLMFLNIFRPRLSTIATTSFSHMGKASKLSVQCDDPPVKIEGIQIGFTVDEMVTIVESVLRSIGLVADFGKLVYIIGHGSSSINNTHYAGYDCGACSGRPGSVNARVFAMMANNKEVRGRLKKRGVIIPETTCFVGGLHDTTRDEFEFYDEDALSIQNSSLHVKNLEIFSMALDKNAKERSRRFFTVNSKKSAEKIHQEVKDRSVSLFEPRPELNHATNALCIIGRPHLRNGLFLDRRAFFNSYDYTQDPNGDLLYTILNAAIPVCGGINLEYYFSRVDNQKLGAGSKLPHNVVGLIGVANGLEGDLRPGLPVQMIEVHDPIRLLMTIEQYPEIVLKTLQRNDRIYEWVRNEWVILTVVHPETYDIYRFEKDNFVPYYPLKKLLDTVEDVDLLVESHDKNFPVYLIK